MTQFKIIQKGTEFAVQQKRWYFPFWINYNPKDPWVTIWFDELIDAFNLINS